MMKVTKRILCLAMIAVMLLALCACGDKEEEKKSGNPGGFVNSSSNSADASTTSTTNWADNIPQDNFNDATFGEW